MKQTTRRQFFVNGLGAFGAWLVGAEALGRILQLAREKRPYLVELDDARHFLYANDIGGEYVLTLNFAANDPEPSRLTWDDWLSKNGVYTPDRREVRRFMVDQGLWDPSSGERYRPPKLDEEVPMRIAMSYFQGEWLFRDSPQAQAFNFLDGIPLADQNRDGSPLGQLEFVDGECPGNDAYFVRTKSVATLGGLQQRLLQLGYKTNIYVC